MASFGGNQDDANFQISQQKYIIPLALLWIKTNYGISCPYLPCRVWTIAVQGSVNSQLQTIKSRICAAQRLIQTSYLGL